MARLNSGCSRFIASVFLVAVSGTTQVASAHPAQTANCQIISGAVTWQFQPATLELSARRNGKTLIVSHATTQPLTYKTPSANHILWPERHLEMRLRPVEDSGLQLIVYTTSPQVLHFPRQALTSTAQTLLWPRGQGVRAPLSDPFWQQEIFTTRWNAVESLSLPLFGITTNDHVMTWLSETPFRNTISFPETDGVRYLNVEQDFTAIAPEMKAVYRFYLDKSNNPIQPALHYRHTLQTTGQFVPLNEKARITTAVELLKGAPHAYLWNDHFPAVADIPRPRWKPLSQKLINDAQQPTSLAHWLRQKFSEEQWKAVEAIAANEWADDYSKDLLATGLTDALSQPDFPDTTTASSVMERAAILHETYPNDFLPAEDWGDGVSRKMLRHLQQAAIRQMRLCVPGHESLIWRPGIVQEFTEAGYLLGTYDSYHSVHPTNLKQNDTWPTAQMTDELYEQATMTRADGSHYTGFRGIGRKLNPVAGSAFAEQRMASNFHDVPYNYYFLDCDATGELHDDYSPSHPLSREEDAAARKARLTWPAQKFGAVIGSEGGHAPFAADIHVAEGVYAPFFGWDSPEMKDPQSAFYRGRYYPPGAPDVFFKPTPLQDRYRKSFYAPEFRIPLHTAIFHDSMVVTAHWNNAAYKYPEVQTVMALNDILFLTPPLIHLNLAEWEKRKDTISDHYKVWGPLHAKHGFEPLTEFRYLTKDHLVQQTSFGDNCTIIVNFSDASYQHESGATVPSLSAWIDAPQVWAKQQIFTPKKNNQPL